MHEYSWVAAIFDFLKFRTFLFFIASLEDLHQDE